jgi:hypothetical protein
MAKVNSLLSQRLKQATEKLSKMTTLAELSSNGVLSSFSGVFRVAPLPINEQESLKEILTQHSEENQNIHDDLFALLAITSEVKAINNQAAILHGERIKKAQEILKKYRDGAFSSWLIAIYGNRQTPYNFLQYYELYTSLPQILHSKLEEMPRQAAYTLASRNGAFEKKEKIIKDYAGQAKHELLALIRDAFPLSSEDKRRQDLGEVAISSLARLHKLLKNSKFRPTEKQKHELSKLLSSLLSITQR